MKQCETTADLMSTMQKIVNQIAFVFGWSIAVPFGI